MTDDLTAAEQNYLYETLGAPKPPGLPRSRAEHLAWCKERALEYVDAGDPTTALASMNSDLTKHPETATHPGIKLGVLLALNGHLNTVDAMRHHIEGFN